MTPAYWNQATRELAAAFGANPSLGADPSDPDRARALLADAGFADGLPVGLQLMADEFQEQAMLDAAHLFEQAARVQRSPEL